MVGTWGEPAPKPEETPEEKEARRKARAEERAKRPVDKSKLTKEQLEKYEEREKRRDIDNDIVLNKMQMFAKLVIRKQ